MLLTSPDSSQQLLGVAFLTKQGVLPHQQMERGRSFGWVNYTLLERGEVSPSLIPYGEDRFGLVRKVGHLPCILLLASHRHLITG